MRLASMRRNLRVCVVALHRCKMTPMTQRRRETAPTLTVFDWEQIRLFLAVVRERSLAGAAQRLALDVSTVSRRLDRLEDQVGAPLFDRTRDGTEPTLLAEQLVGHAEEMELSAARFASAGAAVETQVEGIVRLTVLPGIADLFVVPALAARPQALPAPGRGASTRACRTPIPARRARPMWRCARCVRRAATWCR